jgi:hypothetical protein
MVPPAIKVAVQRMICTSCGSEANATCSCGVAYVPKSQRATEAIKADPIFAQDVNLVAFTQYLYDSADIIAYWNYIPLVYCVKSRLNSTELTKKLHSFFPVQGFLVAEVNVNNINGVLPREAWERQRLRAAHCIDGSLGEFPRAEAGQRGRAEKNLRRSEKKIAFVDPPPCTDDDEPPMR